MNKEHLILPTSYSQLKASAQSALEQFQGSPLKKQGKVTQFLKTLLGYNNEHEMDADLKKQVFIRTKTQYSIVSVNSDMPNAINFGQSDCNYETCRVEDERELVLKFFTDETLSHQRELFVEHFLNKLDESNPIDKSIIDSVSLSEEVSDIQFAQLGNLYIERHSTSALADIFNTITRGDKTMNIVRYSLDIEVPFSEVELVRK